MYRFQLEKGSKKFQCPDCGKKRFVRYMDTLVNGYLSVEVGRCDRESNCGYHKKPNEYFSEVGNRRNRQFGRSKKNQNKNLYRTYKNSGPLIETPRISPQTYGLIPNKHVINTLGNYEQNTFVQFLIDLFPMDIDAVQNAIKQYRIGTTANGSTVFWQIDKRSRIRTGKIIAYDRNTGKRDKSIFPNWMHAVLKKEKQLSNDFNLKQCFFGEHLIPTEKGKPVAIVESEKTAVIASICLPEFTWVAIGSKQSLKFERIKQIGRESKIMLYPDADGFDEWNEVALATRIKGFDVSVSDLIQTGANGRERSNGCDIADYLIHEQRESNLRIETFNRKLEKVLSNEKLYEDCQIILEEQKAILISDGHLSENEAERKVTKPENIRRVVISV